MLNRLAKLREEREQGDRGFTLIELLVVVVIIGVLIAIAIPLYLNYTKGASDKSADSDVRGAVSVLEQCNSDNGNYPTAAFTVVAPAVGAPCTNQKINVSKGTTLKYFVNGAGYTVVGENSNGSKLDYCYDSLNGGSVVSVGSGGAIATASASTC